MVENPVTFLLELLPQRRFQELCREEHPALTPRDRRKVWNSVIVGMASLLAEFGTPVDDGDQVFVSKLRTALEQTVREMLRTVRDHGVVFRESDDPTRPPLDARGEVLAR